jgi:hypothetical protein
VKEIIIIVSCHLPVPDYGQFDHYCGHADVIYTFRELPSVVRHMTMMCVTVVNVSGNKMPAD